MLFEGISFLCNMSLHSQCLGGSCNSLLVFSEANIVRPELPEEADRVEQLLVEFRAVQQRIHDLNQEMEARISVAIEAVAADLRHIFVLTNTGDIMTFDFCQNRPAADLEPEASQ